MKELLSKFKEYVIKKKNPKISIVAKELETFNKVKRYRR